MSDEKLISFEWLHAKWSCTVFGYKTRFCPSKMISKIQYHLVRAELHDLHIVSNFGRVSSCLILNKYRTNSMYWDR